MVHPLPTSIMTTCNDGLVYCFAKWASTVTTGAFWFMALLAFTVSIFLATLRFGSNRAFGFAGFVGLLGGVFLSVLQLIPWWVGSTFIIVGVIGFAVLLISEK
jgi:hypothetical protein